MNTDNNQNKQLTELSEEELKQVTGGFISVNGADRDGSNAPGGSTTIRLRGIGSFYATSEPLYVVDGIAHSTISNVCLDGDPNCNE